MDLTGRQYRMLVDALVDGFSYQQLAMMVRLHMDMELEHIASAASNFQVVVFELVQYCVRRDRVEELVQAARAENPTNRNLYAVAESMGLTTAVEVDGAPSDSLELERLVKQSPDLIDPVQFSEGVLRLQRYMGRVELESVRGSGFLIGPDTILTNYHIVEPYVQSGFPELRVRFDIERQAQSKRSFGGLVDVVEVVISSPPSAAERNGDFNQAPNPDELDLLDFAVLRLARPVGEQIIEDERRTKFGSRIRGWAELDPDHFLQPDSPLLLPAYEPDLRLIVETNAAASYLAADTRMRYHLATPPQWGGGPLLNSDLRVVGLHQSGGVEPFCQGIPIRRIVDYVEAHGEGWVFAQSPSA